MQRMQEREKQKARFRDAVKRANAFPRKACQMLIKAFVKQSKGKNNKHKGEGYEHCKKQTG